MDRAGDGQPLPEETNAYKRVIQSVFFANYGEGDREVEFTRDQLIEVARSLGFDIKNIGDLVYSFRYRIALPVAIMDLAPEGESWRILSRGRKAGVQRYRFELGVESRIDPTPDMIQISIPDATPGIIAMYSREDEQALLAKLRYNRLLDIFTGIACYSLQNHLRTQVQGIGQVEIDEVYVGIDKAGVQYVLPVQAKGGTDRLGMTQIEQDVAACAIKFPGLNCRPIAAQFMGDDVIALFSFAETAEGLKRFDESHYRLVDPEAFNHDS